MFLWGEQKRCVEQIAHDKHFACGECGSAALVGKEAEWVLGGALEVYLECSDCRREDVLDLSPEQARGCGFNPDANLPDTP